MERYIIEQYYQKLSSLISSQFEKKLLNACLDNLVETDNKLRFNNFSYGLRELSRHILNSLAPEEDILRCIWYRNLTDRKDGVTRAQKIQYAIQGGLSDKFVSRIAFSIDIYKTPLLESIELLNKYTHVNNDTFDIPEADVIKFSRSVIDAFSKFLMGINDCRALVVEEIFDEIDVSLIQYSLDRNIAEVDILSTHYNVESIYIEEVLVTGIKSDAIILSANGTINIHQQYGSDGDVSSGDGVEWDTSFPFNSKLKTDLRYPLKKSEMKVVAFEVDTNDWYD